MLLPMLGLTILNPIDQGPGLAFRKELIERIGDPSLDDPAITAEYQTANLPMLRVVIADLRTLANNQKLPAPVKP